MRVSVVCIGNELLMDEGIGPVCARYLLSRYAFPDGVCVLDRACMGMAIISDLRACDRMLVLDAVDVPGARPGDLFSFAPEDVATTPAGMTSLHDVRFADVLGSAELLGIKREGHCLGIQVENMSPSEFVMALTPHVANALPLLAQAAVRHLRDVWGLDVVDRAALGDPLRAGRAAVGARDFSYEGTRRAGAAGEARGACLADGACADCGNTGGPLDEACASEAVAPLELALPAVYGEPDAAVMARYLAQSLAAVGAAGAPGVSAEGGRHAVALRLPGGTAEQQRRAVAVAVRFGLEPDDAGGPQEDVVALRAWVSPRTTDYDCDALIGACLEAVEQARGAGTGAPCETTGCREGER